MIEVSAALFILLIEGVIALALIIALMLILSAKRKKRRRTALAQLVAQIKKQSEVRTTETGSFLQDIYQLEGNDLKKAVEMIDKGEKHLFQVLINGYLTEDPEIITSIDATVAELIDIYKELKPKVEEVEIDDDSELETLRKQIEGLESTNQELREELSITKTTMGNMIAEFGNMFGGGAGHELDNLEVVEKVGVDADVVEELKQA